MFTTGWPPEIGNDLVPLRVSPWRADAGGVAPTGEAADTCTPGQQSYDPAFPSNPPHNRSPGRQLPGFLRTTHHAPTSVATPVLKTCRKRPPTLCLAVNRPIPSRAFVFQLQFVRRSGLYEGLDPIRRGIWTSSIQKHALVKGCARTAATAWCLERASGWRCHRRSRSRRHLSLTLGMGSKARHWRDG